MSHISHLYSEDDKWWCTSLTCRFMLSLRVKLRSQISHWKRGLSSSDLSVTFDWWTLFVCCVRLSLRVNVRLQLVHEKWRFSEWTVDMWRFKSRCRENLVLQWEHRVSLASRCCSPSTLPMSFVVSLRTCKYSRDGEWFVTARFVDWQLVIVLKKKQKCQ